MPDISLTGASLPVNKPKPPEADPFDNGLYLVGSQSYMAYDVDHRLKPMIQGPPRSPGASNWPDGLGRQESYVSTLSSEQPSTTSVTPYDEGKSGSGTGIDGAGVSDGERSEVEELRCKKCGSESFLMVKRSSNAHGTDLKCRRCGEVISDS